jgi:hypothetical protein
MAAFASMAALQADPGQTRFTDWPSDHVAANLFGRLRDLGHKPDRR